MQFLIPKISNRLSFVDSSASADSVVLLVFTLEPPFVTGFSHCPVAPARPSPFAALPLLSWPQAATVRRAGSMYSRGA